MGIMNSIVSMLGGLFSLIVGLAVFAGIIALYFLPFIVASRRKHNNEGAIAILNLLLGWTFIGWVVALVWSFTDNVKENKTDLKTSQ